MCKVFPGKKKKKKTLIVITFAKLLLPSQTLSPECQACSEFSSSLLWRVPPATVNAHIKTDTTHANWKNDSHPPTRQKKAAAACLHMHSANTPDGSWAKREFRMSRRLPCGNVQLESAFHSPYPGPPGREGFPAMKEMELVSRGTASTNKSGISDAESF